MLLCGAVLGTENYVWNLREHFLGLSAAPIYS